MSQDPPTGREDENAATPEGAATPETAGDETQAFDRSPYDVPDVPTEEVPTGVGYGQAPDPSRTFYSSSTSTEAVDDEPAQQRRWLVPVIILAVVVIAAAVAALFLFGGDDEDPLPGATDTEQPTTQEPTEDPATEDPTTEEPTTEEPTTEEPTTEEPATEAPTGGELFDGLEDTVVAGDVTFTLDDDGWVPAQDVVDEGAIEAYEGTFVGGEEEIDMLATLWSGNEAADDYAESLVEAQDSDPVRTESTYADGSGTYWAFAFSESRGRYIWTSDRGHVFQVTGGTDYVSEFFSALPL